MFRSIFKLGNSIVRSIPARKFCSPAQEYAILSDERLSKIAQRDPELEKKLKMLVLEVDVFRQEGKRAPDPTTLTDEKWQHLLSLGTRSARMRYYAFLWQIERKNESQKMKREQRRIATQERLLVLKEEAKNEKHIVYGLNNVSMFLRIYDQAIDHYNNTKLIRAMQYSPKLVIDCSYDSFMTPQEASNAAKQLMLCFAENRANDDPFDLHFCNVDMETHSMKTLNKFMPTMHDPAFPMQLHSENITEVFPHDQIVYLTPHCREDLGSFNPDDIYVVGCMVDKANNDPLSLAKAKRMGIRMARFPLDRYLQWKGGSGKSLTVNQTVRIMLDLKNTGNWGTALKVVPRRKVVDESPDAINAHNRNKSLRQLQKLKVTFPRFIHQNE